MNRKRFCVGITGASGSGKTHLARTLTAHLRRSGASVGLVCEDAYYRDRKDLTWEQRCELNFDHPAALDHDLLGKQISQWMEGHAIAPPRYDYARHLRAGTAAPVEPGEILVVEGILILHAPQVRRWLDLSVFVATDLELCLARRIERDVRDRGRTRDSVVAQFRESVRPMYYRFGEPSRRHADIVVDGAGEVEASIDLIVSHLRFLERAETPPAEDPGT